MKLLESDPTLVFLNEMEWYGEKFSQILSRPFLQMDKLLKAWVK